MGGLNVAVDGPNERLVGFHEDLVPLGHVRGAHKAAERERLAIQVPLEALGRDAALTTQRNQSAPGTFDFCKAGAEPESGRTERAHTHTPNPSKLSGAAQFRIKFLLLFTSLLSHERERVRERERETMAAAFILLK